MSRFTIFCTATVVSLMFCAISFGQIGSEHVVHVQASHPQVIHYVQAPVYPVQSTYAVYTPVNQPQVIHYGSAVTAQPQVTHYVSDGYPAQTNYSMQQTCYNQCMAANGDAVMCTQACGMSMVPVGDIQMLQQGQPFYYVNGAVSVPCRQPCYDNCRANGGGHFYCMDKCCTSPQGDQVGSSQVAVVK